jgi:hypothetical protein
MSTARRTVLVVLVAVLGITLAAAITWGTSQLVRQRIGLASEPLTAGRRLLPPAASRPAQTSGSSTRPASTTSTSSRAQSLPTSSRTTSSPTAPSTATSSSPPSSSVPTGTPVESAPHVVRREGGGDSGSHRDD